MPSAALPLRNPQREPWWKGRLDINGSSVYGSCICANREELLEGLNCDAEALHTIVMLWDFCADSDQPHDAWVVFNAATDKVMEILSQIDFDQTDTGNKIIEIPRFSV